MTKKEFFEKVKSMEPPKMQFKLEFEVDVKINADGKFYCENEYSLDDLVGIDESKIRSGKGRRMTDLQSSMFFAGQDTRPLNKKELEVLIKYQKNQ
jgi:hypothetical protein